MKQGDDEKESGIFLTPRQVSIPIGDEDKSPGEGSDQKRLSLKRRSSIGQESPNITTSVIVRQYEEPFKRYNVIEQKVEKQYFYRQSEEMIDQIVEDNGDEGENSYDNFKRLNLDYKDNSNDTLSIDKPTLCCESCLSCVDRCCDRQAEYWRSCLIWVRATSLIVQQWFEKCQFCRHRSEIFWVICALLLCLVVYLPLTANSKSITGNSPIPFDELKTFMSEQIILASFIFSVYGILFLAIKNYVVYAILFVIQALPSMAFFTYYVYDTLVALNRENIPEPEYIIAAYFFGLYFFWLATHFIIVDLRLDMICRKSFGVSLRNVFFAVWISVFATLIIGFIVYSISTTMELDFIWGDMMIRVLGGPYIITLAMAWIYMHFSFFDPYIFPLHSLWAIDAADLFNSKSLRNQMKRLDALKEREPPHPSEFLPDAYTSYCKRI